MCLDSQKKYSNMCVCECVHVCKCTYVCWLQWESLELPFLRSLARRQQNFHLFYFSPLPVASIIMVICPVSQISPFITIFTFSIPRNAYLLYQKSSGWSPSFFFFNIIEKGLSVIWYWNIIVFSFLIFHWLLRMQNKLYAH